MNQPAVTVLVVDDERQSCALLEKFLLKEGYEVLISDNGFDAIENIKENKPGVVLLDIKMPGIDGIETLKRIRKISKNVVVIMLTAVDDVDVALHAVKEGADDFIRKPIILSKLKLSIDSAVEKRKIFLENIDYQRSLERKVAEQTTALRAINLYLKNMNLEIIRSLAEAIESRDPYLKGHSERVTSLSLAIGREIGLSDDQMETLEYGALLHDIGRIGISETIFGKQGKLTDEEFEHIKQHPTLGGDLISTIGFLDSARDIVKHHHERPDGKGYPEGLDDKQLSILAKIAMIADAFDAMISDRPHRNGMPRERALQILKENKGIQFDPHLVDTFIEKKLYIME